MLQGVLSLNKSEQHSQQTHKPGWSLILPWFTNGAPSEELLVRPGVRLQVSIERMDHCWVLEQA